MGLSPYESSRAKSIKNSRNPPSFARWRTFIHVDQGHNKFWKVCSHSGVVYTNYGLIDTDGVHQIKAFPTTWEGNDYMNTKIREKLGKGYIEIR